ncbi:MAG TPA: hypothetical protein VGG12_03050, partial [Methylovirgula sp.]
LCGLIGLGADVAVWYANAHKVQTMAETAALSAGRLLTSSSQTSATITAVAENDMTLDGYSSASDTLSVAFGPSGKTPPNATTVTVTVKRTLPLLFSNVFLHTHPTVSASATATNSSSSTGVCIYVLAPSTSQSLLVNSNFTMSAPNCEIDVASTASPAAIFDSGAKLSVLKTCIAGSTITNNGGTIGGLTTSCTVHTNPYKNTITAPTVGSCTVNSANYSGVVNLSPGTYCGNFNFNGTGTINLASGTYIFNSTTWNINSGWTITGTGVTLYFVNSSSYVQFNSGVTVSLTAPTSGTYSGVLIFEPDGLSNSSIAIDGTSASGHALQGLVYLPSRNLTFNSTYSGTADQFTLVVNTLIFDSNSPNTWSISPAGSSSSSSNGVTLTN